MTKTRPIHALPAAQRGAILVISLIMLLVLTLLGLTAMQSTTLQERMAGNTREINLAFQAAEAALRDGENQLTGLVNRPVSCSAAPCTVWQPDVLPAVTARDKDWWEDANNAQEYGVDGGTPEINQGVARDPHFVIEELAFIPDSLTVGHGVPAGRNYYRLTAEGLSASETSEAIVESSYARRF